MRKHHQSSALNFTPLNQRGRYGIDDRALIKTATAALIFILGSSLSSAQTSGTMSTTQSVPPIAPEQDTLKSSPTKGKQDSKRTAGSDAKEKIKPEQKTSSKNETACKSRAAAYVQRYGVGGDRYSGPTPAPNNYNQKIYRSALDNCMNTD